MISTADLVDLHQAELQALPVQFRSYGARRRFAGEVVTLRSPDDNILLQRILAEPGEGKVLVVDGGGSLRSALVGDRIAGLGSGNGWAGLVLYGAVRDTSALAGIDIGVLALGSNPMRSGKSGAGESGVELTLEGVAVRPGQFLVADEDGVILAQRVLPEVTP